jgi:hypothetical protein
MAIFPMIPIRFLYAKPVSINAVNVLQMMAHRTAARLVVVIDYKQIQMIVFVQVTDITSLKYLILNAKVVIHLAYHVMDHLQKIAFHAFLTIHLFYIY